MKLHLPKGLRAALIAAITAIGFTLPQTWAADVTLANIMNVGAAADTDITTTVWGDAGSTISSATAQYHITNGSQTPSATGYTNSILATQTNVGTGGTYIYTLNFTTGTLSQPVTLSALKVDFVTFNGAGNGHNQLTAAGVNMIDCTWSLTDTTGGTLDNFELPDNGASGQSTAVYTKSGDSYTTNNFTGGTAKIEFDDITLTGNKTYTLTLDVSKAGGANGFFVGIGNIALVYSPEIVTSTWNGTTEHHTWSDASSWDKAFVENSAAVFNNAAANKNVIVDKEVIAESVTVQDADYTFDFAEDSSLTADALKLSGRTLTLTGGGAMDITNALTGGGVLEIGSTVFMQAEDVVVEAGETFTAQGEGMLMLSKVSSAGTVSISAHNQMVDTLEVTAGSVEIHGHTDEEATSYVGNMVSNAGTTITLTNTNANISGGQTFRSSLDIGQGATVTVSQTDSLQYSGLTNTITVREGGTLDLGTYRWTVGNGTTFVLAGGTIIGAGDQHGALDYHQNNATIRTIADSSISAKIRLRGTNTVIFDVQEGKTLTHTGIIRDSGNLRKTGAGTLVVSGSAEYSGNTVLEAGILKVATEGTLTEGQFTASTGTQFINEGTAVIGKDDVTSSLASTVENTGTLTLKGTINVSTADMKGYVVAKAGTVTYDGTGIYSGSGHLTQDTTEYYLVRNKGGTVSNSATISDVTVTTGADGSLTFTRTIGGTDPYYINSNLTYNEDVMGSATNLVIAQNATLSSTGMDGVSAAKVLHGAGSYIAPAGNNNFTETNGWGLGQNVSLGTDWIGTVVVSGTSAGGTLTNFERLANGTGSTVEVKGLNGWTTDWNGNIDENIKLTNTDSGSAWTNGALSTQSAPEAKFSGKWSGDGTFERTGGGRMDYRYKGDISSWTGKFLLSGNGTTQLTFSDAATEVHAEIAKTSGTLNVVVENDATFYKNVDATQLRVNAGKTATMNVEADTSRTFTGTLAGTGTLNKDGKGELVLGMTGAGDNPTTEVNVVVTDGTFKLNTDKLALPSITVSGNGTLDATSGVSTKTAITLANDATLSVGENGLKLMDGSTFNLDQGAQFKFIYSGNPGDDVIVASGLTTGTISGIVFDQQDSSGNPYTSASTYLILNPALAKYTQLMVKEGNLVLTGQLANDRYWKKDKSDGTWDYTNEYWSEEDGASSYVKFDENCNAHFTAEGKGGAITTITLGDNINAASVSVTGASYTFEADGHTLTVANLFEVAGEGITATVNFGLTGDALKLSAKNGGTLKLGADSSVKAVEIAADSTVNMNSHKLTIADSLSNAGTLTDVSELDLKKGTTLGGKASVGTLKLADNESYTFGDLTATTAITGANANLTIEAGKTLTAGGTAALKNLTTGDSAHLSGNITVAGATNIGGGTTMTGNLTTGTLTGYPLSVSNGHLTIASGSLAPVQFTGTSSVTTNGTITLDGALGNNGDLTLKGTYDASNLGASKSDSKYVEGGSTDNGFEQARLTLTIVEGGNTIAGEATIRFRDKTLTEKVDANGKVTFGGDIDYTKYYVNSGTENASKALDNPNQSLGTFELADATTLEVDKNISMSMVNVATDKSATMLIDADKTVTTDGTAKTGLTLTGAGTLAVDAGKTATGVTLDSTWTGTVSFKNVELTGLSEDWGNENSTVALQNASGKLGNTIVDYALELRKTDENNKWGFGASTGGDNYINGALKGDGDLGIRQGSAATTFTLDGSTDSWSGNFVDNSSGGVINTLALSGAAKTIHGTVGGVLDAEGKPAYAANLYVETSVNTIFKESVMAGGLMMNSGTTNLEANSTIGALYATAGNLSLADNKTLTIRENMAPGTNFSMGKGAKVVLEKNAEMGDASNQGLIYVGGTEGATITNGAGTQQTYSLGNANITVDGAKLQFSSYNDVVVNNVLKNISADNLALNHSLALNNVTAPLTVGTSLSIAGGKTFKVYNNGVHQEVIVGNGKTLTLGNGATLDANVEIADGATMVLNYDMGGTPVATTLGAGTLSLDKGIVLSGSVYDRLSGYTETDTEDKVILFSNVSALTLDGTTYDVGTTYDALEYFSSLAGLSDKGEYTLQFESGDVFINFVHTGSATLTWNGTEGNSTWVQDDSTVTNWLDTKSHPDFFETEDNANFTGDAEVKEVTISGGTTVTRNLTVTGEDAQYVFIVDNGSTISSTKQAKVEAGASLTKDGEGNLTLELVAPLEVTDSTLAVDKGALYIQGDVSELELANAALEIAENAMLSVDTINGDADSTITMDGDLHVDSGSIQSLEAGEMSTLHIGTGTLAIATDTVVYNLVNTGTLDLGQKDLVIAEETIYGGNVIAGDLSIVEDGSTFGDLKVNAIHYAYGEQGDGSLGYVDVDTIDSNGAEKISLDLTEAAGMNGALAPIQRYDEAVPYTLVFAEGQSLAAEDFMLNAATRELLTRNGLIRGGADLEVNEDNDHILQLTVGGFVEDLVWYTDKDVTEWGYQVVSGDALTAGGNTLNGVEHVVVDASRKIDVTGAGSEPGLRVRNITGLDGRTITFTGTEDDTVNLITSEETASNVNVAAENITLKVGLDKLDEMDPVDYKDLRVGDVNLTSATLDVHDHEGLDDSFTVNSLNSDSASLLKGTLIVEGQGGTYNGGYEGATVILHKDADQALAAGEGLTVMGLGLARITYSGTETHMDGIEGIGLRVMLNDVETDNSHRTLTLDNEYSYIVDGALGVGLSAIESGITLDSEAAPDLLRAEHLDMSGSTLYIYQPASDGDTLTMDVNDGGYKRGLLLANLGADDTTADAVQLIGDLYNKYYQNARLQNGRVLVDRRTDYFSSITEPTSENGRAGAGMLDDALLYNNPQATQAGGDLAVVMTALEKGGYTHDRADKVMAAMSGASQAAMGAAWNRDVDRQLRAIRNRTTQMGLAECTHHEGLPYFNAWINAEGDYTKLSGDGTLAGYKLSSWGGTVGVDVDCTARFTVGAAVTAMSGDFTAESMDQAEGDLDRLYVSVFGRYTRRAWTHTLVATFGMADTKLKRTVNYDYGSYNTESSSDGKAFGVMYEVGYVTALNEDASTCLQPVLNLSYRHSSLGGSTEQSASDAALRLGDVDADVFTAAVGARLQSAVGTSVYNRSSIFEGRVMLKFDAGDRDTTASNGFIGVPGSRSTKSTEAGMFGVEVGAGLTIPLSENAGALFFDVTGDFRAKDTEFNGTVGYRYNF